MHSTGANSRCNPCVLFFAAMLNWLIELSALKECFLLHYWISTVKNMRRQAIPVQTNLQQDVSMSHWHVGSYKKTALKSKWFKRIDSLLISWLSSSFFPSLFFHCSSFIVTFIAVSSLLLHLSSFWALSKWFRSYMAVFLFFCSWILCFSSIVTVQTLKSFNRIHLWPSFWMQTEPNQERSFSAERGRQSCPICGYLLKCPNFAYKRSYTLLLCTFHVFLHLHLPASR